MKETTVYDCSIISLGQIHNRSGNITIVEEEDSAPFPVKRIYYLYDVPGGESRGGHSHKDLQQLIVAASGSFDITLDDGSTKRTFQLSRPYYGLYMPPGLWRELNNFSSGAICLVLASENFCESDYIRNYEEFLNYKGK